MRFRIEVSSGHMYEVEVDNFADALYLAGRVSIASKHGEGRVTSLWYFHPDHKQWVSGDELIGR